MAVPLGIGASPSSPRSPRRRPQNTGWAPGTFITNTCASSLILGASGAAADGIYTSNNLIDITDPANAAVPEVVTYVDYMASIGKSDIALDRHGRLDHRREVTVAIIKQAMESPEGLTRASIINAARNFNYTPALGIAGRGASSRWARKTRSWRESLVRCCQYDADTAKTFTDVGELITEFET
jgi:hypothetical protein